MAINLNLLIVAPAFTERISAGLWLYTVSPKSRQQLLVHSGGKCAGDAWQALSFAEEMEVNIPGY